MRIVFDLDNTIVDYEAVFRSLSLEFKLPEEASFNKENFKHAIIQKFGPEKWTLLQGRIYSSEMLKASLFPAS